MPSLFDFNAIAETVYRGTIPNPDWVLVPEGEYPAQCTRIDGREVESTRLDTTYVFAELQWEILDEGVKATTNMEHPTVRQSFSLQMNGSNQLDLGPNQNMALKAVWRACGITQDPSISKIRHQTAYVRVEHRPMRDRDGTNRLDAEGNPVMIPEVSRITSLDSRR